MGLSRGMKVLDVAMGTGAVAGSAVQLVGPEGRVYGCDPSTGMIDWDTIDQAATKETIIRTLEEVGFETPRYATCPLVCERVARKPPRPH